jgi:hypothetical protein
MPCAIGCGGPAVVVFVIGLESNASGSLSQANPASAIRKSAVPWAKSGYIVIGKEGRIGSDDEELLSLKSGAVREIEIGIATEFPAGEVNTDGAGIIKLNEFAIHKCFTWRVVVDLGQHDAGAP